MSGVVGVCIGRVGAGLDSLATGWKWNQNICHRGVLFQHALTKGGLLGSTGTAVNAATRGLEEGVVMGREGAGLDSLEMEKNGITINGTEQFYFNML